MKEWGDTYFRLQQAIGVAYNHDDIGITPAEFITDSAVFGCDLERCGHEALMSGINTKDSKQLTLTVKASQVRHDAVHTLYVFQVFGGIVNIRRATIDIEE